MIKGRVKEWAYAGFAIDPISAFISHWVVDGFTAQTPFPLLILSILIVSYIFYQNLRKVKMLIINATKLRKAIYLFLVVYILLAKKMVVV